MGVLLSICCIYSEYLFWENLLNDCFCINYFRKLFHHRCLTESWINLWKDIIGSNETITRNIGEVKSYSICIFVCWSFNITFLISTNIGSNLTCIILNKIKWFSCQSLLFTRHSLVLLKILPKKAFYVLIIKLLQFCKYCLNNSYPRI